AELEETTERLEHTRADFRNYKERAKRKQEEIKERATEELVERLLDVRDNLSRALEEETADVESLREGVKLTRKQFDRVLDAENVSRIEPEPGEQVDADRHEVMTRVESEQPEGTVASVYRPGYEMAGKVLRAAQVTVSEGNGSDQHPDGDATTGAESRETENTDTTEDETRSDEGRAAETSGETEQGGREQRGDSDEEANDRNGDE
ncbi:MAG: nucleotide exchange factor GrpE, partial [Halodesulfurarchaeum sp.]